MTWRGLFNPERHRDNGADYTWCAECENHDESGCFPADPCRCCLEAQAAAVAAVIAPHMEAYGWSCPCCTAVADTLKGHGA